MKKKNGQFYIQMFMLVFLLCKYSAESFALDDQSERGRNRDAEHFIEQADARGEKLEKRLAARKRQKDPFGATMDPALVKEVVIVPEEVKKEQKVVKIVKKKIPLQSVVNKFQVNGVNAKKQIVMVGFRSLHRGDLVEIKHLGLLFKLRIEKITTSEVIFINTANQETASVRLGVYSGLGSGGGGKSNPLKKNVIGKDSPLKIE